MSSEAPRQIEAAGGVEKNRNGWAGKFPAHLYKKDVKTAFAAEISRRGHGAPEVKICPASMKMKIFSSGCLGYQEQERRWVVLPLQVRESGDASWKL